MTNPADSPREYPPDIATFLSRIGDELAQVPIEERAEIYQDLEKSLAFLRHAQRIKAKRKEREWPQWYRRLWK